MEFYLYINKNILFDYLSKNLIAPDLVVKDIKRNRTIGTSADHFLFVTHKKLSRQSREQGIGTPEFIHPVTLMISDKPSDDSNAILVSKEEDAMQYTYSNFSEYNPEKNIGAFLVGEIPFSRIEKIFFDSQDEMDMFSRPSPDYWYPTDKYALLPDDFTEDLIFVSNEEEILSKTGIDANAVVQSIIFRDRQRAGLLNLVNGTKNWQYDKYLFNMDGVLQEFFGLSDEALSAAMPHYAEVKNKNNKENISLVFDSPDQEEDYNQKLYRNIYNVLASNPFDNQKQQEDISALLNSICEKAVGDCSSPADESIVNTAFAEIDKLVQDTTDKTPEEIMASIPEAINSLWALLFVVKNPNRYDLFLESLQVYRSDCLTRRRAAVLWGTLNGLYGMPGEDFNKDNKMLWQYIESAVLKKAADQIPSLSVSEPEVKVDNGTVLGLSLIEKSTVTAEDVRNVILATPKENLTEQVFHVLLEAAIADVGTKKKAENRGYAHSVASISIPEIQAGDELSRDIRKLLEKLVSDCKKTVPNKEKLYADYIMSDKKFSFVFKQDEEFWINEFKRSLEKLG